MNILFVHETEYIDKMIFEYQIIPEILASRGHRVFVIDFPSQWRRNARKLVIARPEVLAGVSRAKKRGTVTLIRPVRVHLPVLCRSSAFVSYFSLVEKVISDCQIDVVVLFSAPTNGVQTLLAARKHGIPTYFRLLDVLHQLVPAKILRWPTYWFERIVYRNVNQLTAITPRLRDYAVSMGANPSTSRYLPSGADADLFYWQPKDVSLMTRYGIKQEDTVLLFAGTLYNFSGLDKVVGKLSGEVAVRPDLKLLIVGAGEQEDSLRRMIRDLRLENHVILTGFINYPDLPRYINLADICINPFEINKITNVIFPGKIYQYLACGKPVIATKLQGMLDIFPEGSPGSGIFYYDTIEEFFDIVGNLSKDAVEDPNLSLQEIASIMESDLEALCERKGAKMV